MHRNQSLVSPMWHWMVLTEHTVQHFCWSYISTSVINTIWFHVSLFEMSLFSFKLICSRFEMALQVAPSSILVGSHVWVEDPDVAWIDGEVKEVKGEEITVYSTSGKTVSACSQDFM